MTACPCDSGKALAACCGKIHSGESMAETAEALMRSRYSAFVVGNESYLLESWHPDFRPASVQLNPDQKWLGLKIKSTDAGGVDDTSGIVEFVARYKIASKGFRLHETSRFVREDGRWYYTDGDLHSS